MYVNAGQSGNWSRASFVLHSAEHLECAWESEYSCPSERPKKKDKQRTIRWNVVLSTACPHFVCDLVSISRGGANAFSCLVQPGKARGTEVMAELPLSGFGLCLPSRDRENVWADTWIIQRHRNKKCQWVSTGRETRLGLEWGPCGEDLFLHSFRFL